MTTNGDGRSHSACLRYSCYEAFIQAITRRRHCLVARPCSILSLVLLVFPALLISQCRPFSTAIMQVCSVGPDPKKGSRQITYSEIIGSNATGLLIGLQINVAVRIQTHCFMLSSRGSSTGYDTLSRKVPVSAMLAARIRLYCKQRLCTLT